MDKSEISDELSAIEGEVEELREALSELTVVLEERTLALEEARKAGGKSGRVLDKYMKEIGACVSPTSSSSSQKEELMNWSAERRTGETLFGSILSLSPMQTGGD
jgi:chromosome segregation ATPase